MNIYFQVIVFAVLSLFFSYLFLTHQKKKNVLELKERDLDLTKENLYTETVAYIEDREKLAELIGHLRYKKALLQTRIDENEKRE